MLSLRRRQPPTMKIFRAALHMVADLVRQDLSSNRREFNAFFSLENHDTIKLLQYSFIWRYA